MHPSKVNRQHLHRLTDLPNVGPAMAQDLMSLGIRHPNDLIGRDALQMYLALNHLTQVTQDPCVLDVLMSLTDFMAGADPQPWWHFTAARKDLLRMTASH